ncbi:MAG: thiamine biosynthesis protein ThiF [Frankiales bacterium]|nr:thiamine biosynthesis protein ThiF [Frankiales bacterium]
MSASHPPDSSDYDPPPSRLKDAVRVLWRDPHTAQLELGPHRIVVENIASADMKRLLPGRGRRIPDDADFAAEADPPAGSAADLRQLRERLAESGLIDEPPRGPSEPSGPPAPSSARLASDVRSLAARVGRVQATELFRSRQRAAVAVHGTSRLAGTLAATLAAAGVGWVQLVQAGDVRAADACPGGLTPADEGRRYAAAGSDAVKRSAPETRTQPIPRDRGADLVILTEPGPADPAVHASLHLDGLPHLPVSVDGAHAVIGPLVLPGRSSCLRCADLHRSDRDPAWPLLAVQLGNNARHPGASDVALCVAAAGLAATQALTYLDRGRPEVLEATLEWQLPDWRLRRRSWPAHYRCDCGAHRNQPPHGRMAE